MLVHTHKATWIELGCTNPYPAFLAITATCLLMFVLVFVFHQEASVKALLTRASYVLIITCFVVATTRRYCEVPLVKQALSTSNVDLFTRTPSCYVERHQVIADIQEVLNSRRLGLYHLIQGPHGTGKTTAVQESIQASDICGITYESVPFHHVRVDFGMFLANEFKITAMNCLPAIAEPIGYFITGRKCPESEVERVGVALTQFYKLPTS